MVRAFIAVNFPPLQKLLSAINELREMGKAIKPVAPENLHLTLRFLGSTEISQLPAVVDAIRQAVRGVGPFELELVGVGLFPDASRPTVVWAGVRGAEPLARIVHQLTEPLGGLGFTPEERPWAGHLTLARIKARPPAELSKFLHKHHYASFGMAAVSSIDLMLSELLPNGPQYTIHESVAIDGQS